MAQNVTTDPVALVKTLLIAGYTTANVTPTITPTIVDGSALSEADSAKANVKEKGIVIRVYMEGEPRDDFVGHARDFHTEERRVTVDIQTVRNPPAGKTPDLRDFHRQVRNEVKRVINVNRKNPDASWDWMFPIGGPWYQEFYDQVSSRLSVLIRRIWRPIEQ
jgi:hypothetical protein